MTETRADFGYLDTLQQRLQSIYEVGVPFAVSGFVTTDSQLVSGLTSGDKEHVREKLLIRQDGSDLDLSLYLHEDVIITLNEQAAGSHFDSGHFEDLCLAIEGISHFLYLAWRALQKQDVSLLELELQAEVDKYILALSLIRQQKQYELLERLRERLFENIRYDDALDDAELFRYREANHYAAKYCSLLEQRYRGELGGEQMKAELRGFYRLGRHAKFRRIDSQVM
jgi:hypothetical protein